MKLSYAEYRDRRYFPALDGLRAVSIFLVLVLHTNSALWAHLNGGMGVFAFFVISGYLITTLSLREEARRGAVSLRAFYIRRSCRIFPLYYAVLVFYIVLVIGTNYHGHRHLLTTALPYFLTYMNDFAPHLDVTPFAHSWSLGVEEKFYLVWPLLGFLFLRRNTRARIGLLLTLIFVPFALHVAGLLPSDIRPFGSVPLVYAYTSILVGCLLAMFLHEPRSYRVFSHLGTPAGAALTLAVFVLAQALAGSAEWVPFAYSFAVALAIVTIVIGNSWWVRMLASRPFVFVGVRSYGIYLVHVMCLSVVVAAMRHVPGTTFDLFDRPTGGSRWLTSSAILASAFSASLLVAALLNITIERRAIAAGRAWTRRLTGSDPVAPSVEDRTGDGEIVLADAVGVTQPP
ncbi:MAG: acyltransferase family protein [Gaiellaceae bacterium]